MRQVKEFTRGKDHCVDCYYADALDFKITDSRFVACKRNPTKVMKLKDQWCGEFVPYDDAMIQ